MIQRFSLPLLLIGVAVAVMACGLSVITDPRQSEVANVEAFMKAIAVGDDAKAESSMSQAAQFAVSQYCPNGSVTACFDKLGRQNWGNLKEVHWVFGPKESESAYATIWNNDVIDIVFVSSQNNGLWEIDGWRGVISAEDGWPDGVIDGSNPINQFPPPDSSP